MVPSGTCIAPARRPERMGLAKARNGTNGRSVSCLLAPIGVILGGPRLCTDANGLREFQVILCIYAGRIQYDIYIRKYFLFLTR